MVLRRSDTLAGLRTAPETILWERHARGPMSCHIWASELHWLDGAWYLYFAAGDIDDVWNIRPYALRCEGGDPLTGTWREEGLPRRADDFSFNDFSLDLTTFEQGGRRYGVWAGKVNLGKKISNLYIAEMDSPLSFKTPQVLLSAPSYDWERHDFWVNKDPFFLPGKDHVYISFSASATGACYCIGLLCAPAGAACSTPTPGASCASPRCAPASGWASTGRGTTPSSTTTRATPSWPTTPAGTTRSPATRSTIPTAAATS